MSVLTLTQELFADTPTAIHDIVQRHWQLYCESTETLALPVIEDTAFLQSVVAVWGVSDFVAKQCIAKPQMIAELFASGDIKRSYAADEYTEKLSVNLAQVSSETDLARHLREFRYREMVRIAWRDLAGWSELPEVLAELSALADACICSALDYLQQQARETYGVPVDSKGHPQFLHVIALGKLGGKELNFSSDVDLIFFYGEKGELSLQDSVLTYEQFFIRLAQRFIKLLNEMTADGFVFRVDMRLRPYGESGPLVMTCKAMEAYYQQQGRDWERYALMKARLVTPADEVSDELMQLLSRFVFRRYVDFSVISALRNLKHLMDQETRRQRLENNIKRGFGGIREVEFIVQAFQLIRGGQNPRLRTPQFFSGLHALQALQELDTTTIQKLESAYIFLRDLENHLQMNTDQQSQDLPEDEVLQLRLAISMGYADTDSFIAQLQQHRDAVQASFKKMFADEVSTTDRILQQQTSVQLLARLWEGHEDDKHVESLLMKCLCLPYRDTLFEMLQKFRESYRVRSSSLIARQRLDALMPFLLLEVLQAVAPTLMLERLLLVCDSIVRRSAYLTLLLENRQALLQLVELCSINSWFAQQVAQFPLLLDELLDDSFRAGKLDLQGYETQLHQYLLAVPKSDFEQHMELLCRFKLAKKLAVAAADVRGQLPVARVSEHLTGIATAVLRQVLELAWQQSTESYGAPQDETGPLICPKFVIVAYGKLGGIELGYRSDLDLVFLYDSADGFVTDGAKSISNSEFYLRLGQRIVHLLQLRTNAGMLYDIDVRLRPSGKAGLLVSRIDAFTQYQLEKAWTWEHQALVRARPVAGCEELSACFEDVRSHVLCQARETVNVAEEVVAMRQKMLQERDKYRHSGLEHVSQHYESITDIEFMVQYWVLIWANTYPSLVKYTDNSRLLANMAELELLTAVQASALINAYDILREAVHRAAIPNDLVELSRVELDKAEQAVQQIWDAVLSKH